MPKAPLLDDDDITARLAEHPAWRREGKAIARALTFDDFRSAVAFLAVLAGHADEQNHHPDVSIHWNEMTLTLWTHASGGLTERDFRLATTIDRLTED
jgi:4a-hydroxytetrahydrobiopterin dehydratase